MTDIRDIAVERGWQIHMLHDALEVPCDVSRTIEEDTLDLVWNGSQRVNAFYQQKDRSYIAEKYHARLGSVTMQKFSPVLTGDIGRVELYGPSGAAVTAQGDILAQSCTLSEAQQVKMLVMVNRIKPAEEVPDVPAVSLKTFSSENYAHWLMDALPRLMAVNRHDPDLMVIVPQYVNTFQGETLDLLGIQPERRFVSTTDRVIVPRFRLSYASRSMIKPHLMMLQALRDALYEGAGVTLKKPYRRLYVSRAFGARRIVNEEELLPILERHGFEIVYNERLSVAEQIRLYAEARVILGAHGAGMYNLLFAQPPATVIEIYNYIRWEHSAHRMASCLGHNHWHTFGENRSPTHETYVEPSKLEKLLSIALSERFL